MVFYITNGYAFFFYGVANPSYDPYQFARKAGFPRPHDWDEEEEGDYSMLLDPQWKDFSDNYEVFETFIAELDQRWHLRSDPVCIGYYVLDDGLWQPYLAFRASRCLTDRDLDFAAFDLPDPLNLAAWDRLLQAKSETLGLQWA